MTEQWFATSPFTIDAVPEPNVAVDPGVYLVHAKQVGTTSSACGLDSTAWKKHWASFRAVAREQACPRCFTVVWALDDLSA